MNGTEIADPAITTALPPVVAVLLALLGGAISLSTPYLFVSLGECITERSGRVNLGLEGTMILGAVSSYALAYQVATADPGLTGLAPWLGVLLAGCVGVVMGALHAFLCSRPRVNHIAVGIALMVFGVGLAIYLGKPYIQPKAPHLQALALGDWSPHEAVRSALKINGLFLVGVAVAPLLSWSFVHTRWGMILRMVGESSDAARALGYSVQRVRLVATCAGGFLAGVGGSFLSLYNPGIWAEGLSRGQGLMAVALVIFARWNPLYCLFASLMFGAAEALGPALQNAGLSRGYQLYAALPAALTLLIMIATCSTKRTLAGAPAELTVS
jgi:general nucleoside transport system permease protein